MILITAIVGAQALDVDPNYDLQNRCVSPITTLETVKFILNSACIISVEHTDISMIVDEILNITSCPT